MKELQRILFVAATESDALKFIGGLSNVRVYRQKVGLVHGGIWHRTSAKCLITGHNPDAAAAGLKEAIRIDKPVAIISIGFCSALDASLNVGDIVVGVEFQDMTGMHSRYGTVILPEETRAMMAYVLRTVPGIRGRLGRVVTVYDPISDPREKLELYAQTKADVMDQSAVAIANIAKSEAIPFVIARAVFDVSDEKVPDIERYVRENARLSTTKLIGKLALKPTQVFSLRDVVSRARLCRERLEVFTEAFWNALLENKDSVDFKGA